MSEQHKRLKTKTSGHGSITKAGKVRGQTPKVPHKDRFSPGPRLGSRSKRRKQLQNIRRRAERHGQQWHVAPKERF